jgi:transcriptional regulator with XRE-family HTH domain
MREGVGLSIRDLELRTGINRGRLSIIERGVTASPDETARILTALAQAAADRRTGDAA